MTIKRNLSSFEYTPCFFAMIKKTIRESSINVPNGVGLGCLLTVFCSQISLFIISLYWFKSFCSVDKVYTSISMLCGVVPNGSPYSSDPSVTSPTMQRASRCVLRWRWNERCSWRQHVMSFFAAVRQLGAWLTANVAGPPMKAWTDWCIFFASYKLIRCARHWHICDYFAVRSIDICNCHQSLQFHTVLINYATW